MLSIKDLAILVPNCSHRILILGLLEHHTLNELIQLERLVGRADRRPILLLLELILQELSALTINQCKDLSTDRHKLVLAGTVGFALVIVNCCFLGSQLVRHLLKGFILEICNLVFELCYSQQHLGICGPSRNLSLKIDELGLHGI